MYELLNGPNSAGNPDLAQDVANPQAVIARQRFVENFSGQELNADIWTTSYNVGAGSNPTPELGGGGVLISSASGGTGNKWQIDFGPNEGVFDPAGCTMIVDYQKVVNDTASAADVFLTPSPDESDPTQYILVTDEGSGVKLYMQNSGFNQTDTGMPSNNQQITAKIDSTSSQVRLSLYGVLRATSTANIPTSGVNPCFRVRGRGVNTNVHQMRVSYCEVYNT